MDDPKHHRANRGIFGVRHSKKRPMMFSFTPVRGDEWPTSSDDSDQDFDINNCSKANYSDDGSDSTKHLKKGKQQKRKKSKKSKKERKTQSRKLKVKRRKVQSSSCDDDEPETTRHDDTSDKTSWSHLPTLILQKIFYFGVADGGAVPFLLRMSKVSRTWRDVATLPKLWRKVNLDSSTVKVKESKRFTGLTWLINNRFSKLENLNICNWSKLNQSTFENIVKECPSLKRLVLSGCIKLGSSSLEQITNGLSNLVALDISSITLPGKTLNPSGLSRFLEVRGGALQELNLSNNKISSWPGVFSPILKHENSMPYLRHLDLSNCLTFSSSLTAFPVESFQSACPNLEVLSLAGCDVVGSKVEQDLKESSCGFPRLEQLSFPVQSQVQRSSSLQQDLVQRILKTSVNLQLLDIRGRTSFTPEFAQNLPCTGVEYLYIGNCDGTIIPLCTKWGHSLKTLHMPDISMKGDVTIASVLPSMTKLENLDLAGTDIDDSVVRLVFDSCPSLDEINLTRCRNIQRGIKQTFKGQRLKELAEKMTSTS
ncbi:hypothetical protein BSL78_12426 [Apostichopus japonicus]|uniref:F-box domain-containing protein n=1 Tax=Stichopus japonicus TaxID=307972 RepID=A0A2G8KRQ5_STIJA|nr:hypothetical protein BSL78_12426 [Apostichopus japonicus]